MKQKRLTKKEIQSIKEPEATEEFVVRIDFTRLPLNLDLAGIYYVGAYVNYLEGLRRHKKLLKEIARYKKAYERRAKKYPLNSDQFVHHMLHKIRNIEIFYEPVVRHFSTLKILLVCCAEAFVNEVAGVCLNGRRLDEFDKLSITGKWLLIQDILKVKKQFNLDSHPMQGFGLLIKERNKLVHFKRMKKSLKALEIPQFINDLKLTPKDCESNLKAVSGMITTLSLKWKGSFGPDWLQVNETNFRNPCFYLMDRESPLVLYSDEYDRGRHS